jgi:hypothetical protein
MIYQLFYKLFNAKIDRAGGTRQRKSLRVIKYLEK